MTGYYEKGKDRVYGTIVGFYGDPKGGFGVLCMEDGTFESVKISDLRHIEPTNFKTKPSKY